MLGDWYLTAGASDVERYATLVVARDGYRDNCDCNCTTFHAGGCTTRVLRLPNGFGLSCTAKAYVPKPTRHDACDARTRRLLYSAPRKRRAINGAGGVPPANLVC